MKKILAILLILAVCFTLFSCGKEDLPTYEVNENTEIEYSGEYSPKNDGESASDATEPAFDVKGKKYDYNGTNVLILNVTNNSSKCYDIAVKGTYYDEQGEALCEDGESFYGIEPGYTKYFVFDPGIVFDKFDYTFESTEAIEAGPESKISITPISLEARVISIKDETWLFLSSEVTNDNGKNVFFNLTTALFDPEGEIIYLHSKIVGIEGKQTIQDLIYSAPTDEFVWPEEMKENITAIYSINCKNVVFPD